MSVCTALPQLSRKKIAVLMVLLLLIYSVLVVLPSNGLVEGEVRKGVDFEFCVTADDSPE